MINIFQIIADELTVPTNQVTATVALLDEGATVPFISRYRKEVTGGLDDTQLRHLDDRLRYLRELEERKQSILNSIDEQGKLSDELKNAISSCTAKNTLEDLYLPYKKKRRTKGQIAIEAGIEPLADSLLNSPELAPEVEAAKYLNAEKEFSDVKAVLDGAKYILMERFAEDATLIAKLRNFLSAEAHLIAQVAEGKESEAAKFRDYFEYSESYQSVPSHRALAVFRGRNEGFLQAKIDLPQDGDEPPKLTAVHPGQIMIAEHLGLEDQGRAGDAWLKEVIRWTWRIKLHTHIETDLMTTLREKAEEGAISVFADNLKDLLLAAPAGAKATIGIDPGLRTGCKVAVVDHTGKLVDFATIYPTPPKNQIAESAAVIVQFAKKHNAALVAIGNGTASRETDKFVGEIMKEFPDLGLKKVVVNEAGASVYSASEFAAKEFPDLDVTIRGAVSIARRLQDPLAELVKIEPKSIGVGQYQHDVSQVQLARSLDGVVEDCVNAVGVDVNMASVALLSRVSGLNARIAQNIVDYRDLNGTFATRDALKEVPRFGDKTFEQAAGFLRVRDSDNPLDNSSVHPESYALVETISNKAAKAVTKLIGDTSTLKSLKPQEFVTEQFGLPTIQDILSELQKPGRDPRPEFKTADFKEGVEKISDLKPAMILEGTVTNVTNFGAFIDIGVHQDGLVHISAMSESFISDPREVVKAGEIVKVKVMEVDVNRKRIGLSMRLSDDPAAAQSDTKPQARGRSSATSVKARGQAKPQNRRASQSDGAMGSAFAAAFAKAKRD
ncbi:MAG: RNA-binding transcriptional accessory protein [Pseudomonadales bacterium]|nr:RNA-binding transcriptional accessory protein [Pseudomonadales bacterium]